MTDRNIIPFSFDDYTVRVVMIDGQPWFVASDVARALGYANPAEAVSDHCKYLKFLNHSDLLGLGMEAPPSRGLNLIPEGDVFRLIVKSSLPGADQFERKVFDEILPQIRQTGSYGGLPAELASDPIISIRVQQIDHARRLARQEEIAAEQDWRVRRVEHELGIDGDHDTARCFLQKKRLKPTKGETVSFGLKCRSVAVEMNINPEDVQQVQEGSTLARKWPVTVLREAYRRKFGDGGDAPASAPAAPLTRQ